MNTRIERSRLASRLHGLTPSLYARILSRLKSYDGEVYPFHIGETHLLPVPDVINAMAAGASHQDVHRYGHPQGIVELRTALATRLEQTGMPNVCADDVVITHGATHGLHLACQAILNPGDVMLVLSPHWPLLNPMVHTQGAVPIEVPFTCQLRSEKRRCIDILEASYQPRARAIYVTSPNNPDGTVLQEEELQDIAVFAKRHDLFVIVDEAYDVFHYTQRPPRLIGFDEMRHRTISVHTFSKSHRMTGLRVGFAVAPPDVRDAMIRLSNISIYNVSLLMQKAALAAIEAGEEIVDETVAAAFSAREYFCDALKDVPDLSFRRPEGGAYVFADLTQILKGETCEALLERGLDSGVVFAPGAGFGRAYSKWARFCFTAMERPRLIRGTEKLVALLTQGLKAPRT